MFHAKEKRIAERTKIIEERLKVLKECWDSYPDYYITATACKKCGNTTWSHKYYKGVNPSYILSIFVYKEAKFEAGNNPIIRWTCRDCGFQFITKPLDDGDFKLVTGDLMEDYG